MARTAIHPGEHLADELKALGMSAAALSRDINVPVNRITGIINGTRAITADRTHQDDGAAVSRALDAARKTSHLDGLVAAYRSYPPLLTHMLRGPHARQVFMPLVRDAHDASLARRYASVAPSEAFQLSPREHEVLGLLARSFSNRRIAAELFISEATVKVHVRHIFEKLGVSTRTEAVLHFLADSTQAAPRSR